VRRDALHLKAGHGEKLKGSWSCLDKFLMQGILAAGSCTKNKEFSEDEKMRAPVKTRGWNTIPPVLTDPEMARARQIDPLSRERG
jgi:hypothetical protein